jgi:hypothetical protein
MLYLSNQKKQSDWRFRNAIAEGMIKMGGNK